MSGEGTMFGVYWSGELVGYIYAKDKAEANNLAEQQLMVEELGQG